MTKLEPLTLAELQHLKIDLKLRNVDAVVKQLLAEHKQGSISVQDSVEKGAVEK